MLHSTLAKNAILLDVRDYECDMQGIVNNAVYQNYLEHARHTFLKSKGLDFDEITKSGVHLVLMKVELDYKKSLKSGDQCLITTEVERVSRFKVSFFQKIVRTSDQQLILEGKVLAASIDKNGKPIVFEDMESLFL